MRSAISGVLLTLGVILIPITLLGQWVQNYVLNTSNFVATFEPVAKNSLFQDYLATELAASTASAVEESQIAELAQSLTGSVDSFFSQFGLNLGLEETTTGWSNQLAETVGDTVYEESLPALQSPQFVEAWNQAVQQIHSQVVAGLLGEGPETQVLTIEVTPFIGIIEEYLDQSGFSFAKHLPNLAAGATIPVVEVTYQEPWRTFTSLVDEYGYWLPWVNGGVLLFGLLLARNRWGSLAGTAFAAAFASGLVWLIAPLLGGWVISDISLQSEELSFAKGLWNLLTQPLLDQALIVGAASLALGVIALIVHLLTRGRV